MTSFQVSRNDADIGDNTAVNVEDGIEDQRAQDFVLRLLRRGDPPNDRFENEIGPDSHLRARFDRFLGRNGEDILELALHRRNVSIRQVDLVDHGNDR